MGETPIREEAIQQLSEGVTKFREMTGAANSRP